MLSGIKTRRSATALEARPAPQQIAYAYALRNATVGWPPRLQRDVQSNGARGTGGNSFRAFPTICAPTPSREVAAAEVMPPGLLDRLNTDELPDLIAQVLSAGNP